MKPEIDLPLVEAIRRRIEHEDNLTCQRLSFLVNSQSFLLTGYAITLNAPIMMQNHDHQHAHDLILRLLPICAIICLGVLFTSLLGGLIAMVELRRLLPSHYPTNVLLTVEGTRRTRLLGQSGPTLVPLLFLTIWFILLLA